MDNLKDMIVTFSSSNYYSNLKIKLPRFCPHCSQAISAITVEIYKMVYSEEKDINFILHRCPDCSKLYISLHLRPKGSGQGATLEFISIYPNTRKALFHRLINEISPRFIDVYNQAFTAEQQNHFEVAGAGYRLALEILIKDFAINALKKEPAEVRKKNLADALKAYVDEQDALTSADVVRHLGNDYVHYEQKYVEVEFAQLKWYLDMFIKSIETKLLFLNPPVPTRMVDQQIQ